MSIEESTVDSFRDPDGHLIEISEVA